MMLQACSTMPPNAAPICPISTECRSLNVHIRTNGDLAESLSQALERLALCDTAYRALNQCMNQPTLNP